MSVIPLPIIPLPMTLLVFNGLQQFRCVCSGLQWTSINYKFQISQFAILDGLGLPQFFSEIENGSLRICYLSLGCAALAPQMPSKGSLLSRIFGRR